MRGEGTWAGSFPQAQMGQDRSAVRRETEFRRTGSHMPDVTGNVDLRVKALYFEDELIVHGVILHMQIRSSNQTI